LIIACVGDISKLQLYIWSSYGLLAEIKKFFSLSSQSSLIRSLCISISSTLHNIFAASFQNDRNLFAAKGRKRIIIK
jgi:hypothetical protein